jgi:NAD(P)-dependent dehydrogenase (short-subunit alcohol dehydrogenase family)
MDFTGKIAVVTGAGSGIGQACAREFVAQGAAVAVVDRDLKGGSQTAGVLPGPAEKPRTSKPEVRATR